MKLQTGAVASLSAKSKKADSCRTWRMADGSCIGCMISIDVRLSVFLTGLTMPWADDGQHDLTPTDEILSLTGQSQIPVPLGHLSLLVFDTLPGEAKNSWSTESGVVLGQKDDSDRGFPRRPFDPNTKPKRTSSGSGSATYTVKSKDGSRVTIDKKYKLDSPNSETPFTFAGGGTVVFDSEIGMFASADLKYDLKLSSKNVEVRIPVTIAYQLLTKERSRRAISKEKRDRCRGTGKGDGGRTRKVQRFLSGTDRGNLQQGWPGSADRPHYLARDGNPRRFDRSEQMAE
jgi:hypothetical protein